jgi:hypothetical protein
MSKPYTTVRIIPHEESFEVRVSTYFYFDEDAGRRAVSGRIDQESAKKQAQEFARAMRDGTHS